jgi:hypothetical protein
MPVPAFLQAREALLTALQTPSSTTAALEQVAFLVGVSEASIELLLRGGEDTVGSPLCGGPAKIKHVDQALADQLPSLPSLLALEADWIGTTLGLYYVTPRANSVLGWTWGGDIAGIAAGRRLWKFGGVRVTTSGGAFEMRTAASLVDVLMAMTERFSHGWPG